MFFHVLSPHMKNNIILKMTKNIKFFITFIVHRKAVVVQDHFITPLLRFAKPFCNAAVAKSTVHTP
jgi:hypothetical protein